MKLKHFNNAQAAMELQAPEALSHGSVAGGQQSSIGPDAETCIAWSIVGFGAENPATGSVATEIPIKSAKAIRVMNISRNIRRDWLTVKLRFRD